MALLIRNGFTNGFTHKKWLYEVIRKAVVNHECKMVNQAGYHDNYD